MTTHNQLTIHLLQSLPLHNVNRDDRGMPKTIKLGGVTRAIASSQSLKRAARVAYESEVTADRTARSARFMYQLIADRAVEVATAAGVDLPAKEALTRARKLVVALLAKDVPAAPEAGDNPAKVEAGPKDTSIWLSADEIGLLAQQVVDNASDAGDLGKDRTTGSLSIALLGRMIANAQDRQTDAAVAVTPAVTVHKAIVDVDYFTTFDDLARTYTGSAGAAYLDTANYTSGVYYRSITFDRAQLHRSWSAAGTPEARERLAVMVRALIVSLPQGKKNSTGAATIPLLVLAETQRSRFAYDFETPVQPGPDGGYSAGAVASLVAQRADIADWDKDAAGAAVITGRNKDAFSGVDGVRAGTLEDLIDHVVTWAL